MDANRLDGKSAADNRDALYNRWAQSERGQVLVRVHWWVMFLCMKMYNQTLLLLSFLCLVCFQPIVCRRSLVFHPVALSCLVRFSVQKMLLCCQDQEMQRFGEFGCLWKLSFECHCQSDRSFYHLVHSLQVSQCVACWGAFVDSTGMSRFAHMSPG